MILQSAIAVLAGGIGSYLSYFNTKLLSSNIESLASIKAKWVGSYISLAVCVLGVLIINPETVNQWVEYGFLVTLFFIACIDSYSKIIPNTLVLVLLLFSAAPLFQEIKAEAFLASISITLAFIALNFLVDKLRDNKAFGWGDIKLIGVMGFYHGWDIFWVVYIAIILGGLLSIVGLLLKKINTSVTIPFAIFLWISYLIVTYTSITSFFSAN
ncbi:MAG: prepilin peptidase [Balneolaceae bacterium]